MDLYEYQGKELFRRVGHPGRATGGSRRRRRRRVRRHEVLGGPVVVKAQVLTGGRGKAGGIKLATTPARPRTRAKNILGLDIRGHVVRGSGSSRPPRSRRSTTSRSPSTAAQRSRSSCSRRRAASRSSRSPSENPEALVRLHVDPLEGFHPWQARRLVYGAGVDRPIGAEADRRRSSASSTTRSSAFDAMLCEINPLIVTPDGEVKALDSKFTVDDNALYRHPDDRRDARRRRRRPARGAGAREGRHLREARRRGRRARQRRRADDVDRRRRHLRRRPARQLLRPRRRRRRPGCRRRALGDHAATRR